MRAKHSITSTAFVILQSTSDAYVRSWHHPQHHDVTTMSSGSSSTASSTTRSINGSKSRPFLFLNSLPFLTSTASSSSFTSFTKTAPTALYYRTYDDDNAYIQPSTAPTTGHDDQDDHTSIPCWIQRYQHSTPRMATTALRNLNVELHAQYDSDVAEEVTQAIDRLARDSPVLKCGMSEYVQGILFYIRGIGRDALLAALMHYMDCYNECQQDVMATNGSSSTLDCDSGSDDEDLDLNDHKASSEATVQYIARNAMKLKHAESMAHKTNNDELRSSMLVSLAGDWRAMALRAYTCLFHLESLSMVSFTTSTAFDGSGDNLNYENVQHQRASGREALQVYNLLSQRMGLYKLKNALEDVAFQLLYPRQYRTVMELLRQKEEGYRAVLEEVTVRVKRALAQDTNFIREVSSVRVVSRLKEPYSLWRKILKKRSKDISDAVALRVIVSALPAKGTDGKNRKVLKDARDKALCYYVQNLCMQMTGTACIDKHRIKDYILNPKGNGYMSLHYTADMRWHGEIFPFEIQVRSKDMHRVAEHGIAAHWSYKQEQQQNLLDGSKRFVDNNNKKYRAFSHHGEVPFYNVDRHARVNDGQAPYLEALQEAHFDQMRDHVYVFLDEDHHENTSSTRIVSLPAGSNVRDAIGVRGLSLCIDNHVIIRNGKVCNNLSQPLRNGDVVKIPPLRVPSAFA